MTSRSSCARDSQLRSATSPEIIMHFTFSLPNPLARLTGVLEAVERARAAAAAKEEAGAQGDAEVPPAALPANRNEDLDSLSLSRCGDSLEASSHDLEAMSLSRCERADESRGDT
jgi:hypothetical protein